MNGKRIFSSLVLLITLMAVMLSLASCAGKDSLEGIETHSDFEISYNYETDVTDVTVTINAVNNNFSHRVVSYKYKLVFRNIAGDVLSTGVYNANTNGLLPGDSDRIVHGFYDSDGTGIRGNVKSVEVTPLEMTIDNDEIKAEGSSDSSSSGKSKWTFWTWLWIIVSGVLVYLFFTVCSQEDWDSDTVIGSVVIFILPAVVILVVYFGFFFGSGV